MRFGRVEKQVVGSIAHAGFCDCAQNDGVGAQNDEIAGQARNDGGWGAHAGAQVAGVGIMKASIA